MILIDRARDPAIWRWFDLLLSPPPGNIGNTSIDNRLETVAPTETSPDSFLAKKPSFPAGENREPGKKNDPSPSLSLSPEDFDAVRDDTPSTRDEQACSLRLLDILNRTDPQTLSKASLGPVTYAQLFRQPNQYRGRLVTVSGVVRRANRVELFKNDYGIKEYYQVWLWPSDNPSAPIVVYCLHLPAGFPTGMEFAEQAELTGFFFKRWAYQAEDAIRTAPTLLAQTLQWRKRPVMTPAPAETWAIPLVVGLAALFALLAVCYVYLRTRPTRPALPDRPPDFNLWPRVEDEKKNRG